jgi:hypothetical protein
MAIYMQLCSVIYHVDMKKFNGTVRCLDAWKLPQGLTFEDFEARQRYGVPPNCAAGSAEAAAMVPPAPRVHEVHGKNLRKRKLPGAGRKQKKIGSGAESKGRLYQKSYNFDAQSKAEAQNSCG